MNPALLYLIKVTVCSALLTGYYFIALRNKVFHQWNRFYLLLSVLFSLVIPLFQFTLLHTPEQSTEAAIRMLAAVQSGRDELVVLSPDGGLSFARLLPLLYGTVSIILAIGLFASLFRIAAMIRQHSIQEVQSIWFVPTEVKGTPFSFFRYIFWNKAIDINSPSGTQIFKHELVHVREWHTFDKILMQVVLIFFWCNPFLWLIRFELRMIHEFIADRKSVAQQDATQLAALILQTAYPTKFDQIINPFFHQSIKRRLIMLAKIQNKQINYLSRLAILPVLVLVGAAFTVKTKAVESGLPLSKENLVSVMNQKVPVRPDRQVQLDTIPKGLLVKDIVEMNVRADKTVEIKLRDGSTHTYTEKELRDAGLLNDPSGVVVKVGKETTEPANMRMSGSISMTGIDTARRPLLVLNGEVYPFEALNSINPEQIAEVKVLKDKTAIATWGEKGANGVIEVVLRAGIAMPPKNGPFVPFSKKTVSFSSDSIRITNEGNLNIYTPSGRSESEPTFTKVETEPQFVGGQVGWRNFLQKNLNKDIAPRSKLAPGTYVVTVQFIVGKDGAISNVEPVSKIGEGLEEEVVRLMKISPRWVPAVQNGINVRAYTQQRVTFVIAQES
ncbi:MAG TPA: M56 family metallopeptidase [Flavisolibacter sp.]|jgi:hypothetical protein|nr:M56 family metallopeptidase [Flavisolibacter sp.]